MSKPITQQQLEYFAARINYVLFHADVMHTCCVENDCFDEYERIAFGIAENVLIDGKSLADSIGEQFELWFGFEDEPEDPDDTVLSASQIEKLAQAIEHNPKFL